MSSFSLNDIINIKTHYTHIESSISPDDLNEWTDKGWWIKAKDDQGVYSGWAGVGSDNKIYVDTPTGIKELPYRKFYNAYLQGKTVVIYNQGLVIAYSSIDGVFKNAQY